MNSPYRGNFRVSQEFKGSIHDGLDLVGVDSKEIHSTIDGVVEKAGWENSANKKQGFGLFVRIKANGSEDRYYFGHLSQINVTIGQAVKTGYVIGIEGSTGNSTGSHCHYCIRGNCSKSQIRDISKISGIPNKIGTYTQEVKKSDTEIAREVIAGKWGNGADRKEKLTKAGYDYSSVQAQVNKLVKGKKSNEEIAMEVIKGLWGNGKERKERLKKAGYDYPTIQALVNNLL